MSIALCCPEVVPQTIGIRFARRREWIVAISFDCSDIVVGILAIS